MIELMMDISEQGDTGCWSVIAWDDDMKLWVTIRVFNTLGEAEEYLRGFHDFHVSEH